MFGRHYPWPIVVCCGAMWAASPGLRYLGDLEDLGTLSAQEVSIRFGRAEAVSLGDGKVRFQGGRDAGDSWQATLPINGGLGYTTVWQADFDRNSRADLLIAAYFPKNGRCIDEITLSFLLFDKEGRPTPWVTRTRMPASRRYPSMPAIFSGLESHAELVLTDCEYSAPPRLGEDRKIVGIYQAKDATWSLVRPDQLGSYVALVKRRHVFRPGADVLLPVTPASWADEGNASNLIGPTQVKAVLPASPTCRGIRLPIVDGRVVKDLKDPCDEIGRNRLELSDGTICYGWPTAMIDRPGKREIVADSESHDLKPLLDELVDKQLPVTLNGQRETGRCSPVLLTARSSQ